MKKYKAGDKIDEDFLILKSSVEQTKKGKDYISFDARNLEGRVFEYCRRWDCSEPITGVVRIVGKLKEFKGDLQLVADKWCKGKAEAGDFSPRAPWKLDEPHEMYCQLLNEITYISDKTLQVWTREFLRKLTILTFPKRDLIEDEKPEIVKLHNATGARGIHHAYKSGWLEHTLEVVKLTRATCGVWFEMGHINVVEFNLAMVGAMLHDIGKLYQFELVNGSYQFTDICKAYGYHSNAEQIIGSQLLLVFCLEHGFPLDGMEAYYVIHNIICSHHGKQFSIAPPVYKVSHIVHFADHMSANVNRLSFNLFDKDEVNRDKVYESYLRVRDYGEGDEEEG